MIFSDYAKFVNGKFLDDIEKKNIKNAKKFVGNNEKFVEFVTDDSVKFLSSFNKNIDFFHLHVRWTI